MVFNDAWIFIWVTIVRFGVKLLVLDFLDKSDGVVLMRLHLLDLLILMVCKSELVRRHFHTIREIVVFVFVAVIGAIYTCLGIRYVSWNWQGGPSWNFIDSFLSHVSELSCLFSLLFRLHNLNWPENVNNWNLPNTVVATSLNEPQICIDFHVFRN